MMSSEEVATSAPASRITAAANGFTTAANGFTTAANGFTPAASGAAASRRTDARASALLPAVGAMRYDDTDWNVVREVCTHVMLIAEKAQEGFFSDTESKLHVSLLLERLNSALWPNSSSTQHSQPRYTNPAVSTSSSSSSSGGGGSSSSSSSSSGGGGGGLQRTDLSRGSIDRGFSWSTGEKELCGGGSSDIFWQFEQPVWPYYLPQERAHLDPMLQDINLFHGESMNSSQSSYTPTNSALLAMAEPNVGPAGPVGPGFPSCETIPTQTPAQQQQQQLLQIPVNTNMEMMLERVEGARKESDPGSEKKQHLKNQKKKMRTDVQHDQPQEHRQCPKQSNADGIASTHTHTHTPAPTPHSGGFSAANADEKKGKHHRHNNKADAKAKSAKRKRSRRNKNEPQVCQACSTTSTPEWRMGPAGPRTLCNACGLRWRKKLKERVSVERGPVSNAPLPTTQSTAVQHTTTTSPPSTTHT